MYLAFPLSAHSPFITLPALIVVTSLHLLQKWLSLSLSLHSPFCRAERAGFNLCSHLSLHSVVSRYESGLNICLYRGFPSVMSFYHTSDKVKREWCRVAVISACFSQPDPPPPLPAVTPYHSLRMFVPGFLLLGCHVFLFIAK